MLYLFPTTVMLGFVLLLGCSKEPAEVPSPSVKTNTSQTATNGPKYVVDMAPGDVIVSVNGAALTRADFDLGMSQVQWQISMKPNASQNERSSIWQGAGQTFIPRFINQQLLEQDAVKRKVISEKLLEERVQSTIERTAKHYGISVTELKRRYPGGEKALVREAEQNNRIVMLVASNIPPKLVVDDTFMAAVKKNLSDENAAITASNLMWKAKVETIREEIQKGKDFALLADQYADRSPTQEGKGGYWGDFQRSTLDNPALRAPIFALKPGQVSEVLEDDEGYYLVKVLEAVQAIVDPKGKVTRPERYSLARIFFPKEPLVETGESAIFKADLQRQMQQQAIDAYVSVLQKEAVIRYPHGTNFWKSPEKAPSPAGARKEGASKDGSLPNNAAQSMTK